MDNNIKFPLEMEEGGRGILNFLDVKIIRTDEEIRITIYRKATDANHISNEKCKTLKGYKWATLRAYVNQVIEICFNKELLREEIRAIKTIAKTASFKTYIVDKLYRKHNNKKLSIINPLQNARTHWYYLVISSTNFTKLYKSLNHLPNYTN